MHVGRDEHACEFVRLWFSFLLKMPRTRRVEVNDAFIDDSAEPPVLAELSFNFEGAKFHNRSDVESDLQSDVL